MVAPFNRQHHSTLDLIRQHLTPEQQQQFDELSLRPMRELAAVADEREDGGKRAAQNFCWLRPELIKYVGASFGTSRSR